MCSLVSNQVLASPASARLPVGRVSRPGNIELLPLRFHFGIQSLGLGQRRYSATMVIFHLFNTQGA